MGCSAGDGDYCSDREKPAHAVTLSSFKMLETEVTESQYSAVMGENPSCNYNTVGGPNNPVECVTWIQAKEFCEAIGGRLPTEAEWEYAARGGTTTRYYCGDSASCLGGIEWYSSNSEAKKNDVKGKTANAYGMYDMLGNVKEWTADWYDEGYYSVSPSDDPLGPASGSDRVIRGGFFISGDADLRVSYRGYFDPSYSNDRVGLRCARSEQAASCGDGFCDTDETCDACPGDCACTACGEECVQGACTFAACDGRECGPDGCGGSCGSCEEGLLCIGGGCEVNQSGLKWISIPGGTFQMGCSPGDEGCADRENPAHAVTLSPFEMLETEVTESQYSAVMGENPSCNYNAGGGPNNPVECVTWFQAKEFCETIDGRLPTEAEWEYAARGGTTTKYYCGDDVGCVPGIAWWYNPNSDWKKQNVKGKAANAFGLYDMLGSVWEWTADWLDIGYYSVSPSANPPGPASGFARVSRGGGFLSLDDTLRVSARNQKDPSANDDNTGIRCARDAP